MKRLILSLVLLGLLTGGGFAAVQIYKKYAESAGAEDTTPGVALERRPLFDRIEVIGQIKARESDILNSPFNGKIRRLIPEGSFVEAGDVVAEMETTEIEEEMEERIVDLELRKSELAQREAEYELLVKQHSLDRESDRAQVEFNTVALEDAKRNFAEQQKLVERNLVSQSTLESSRLDLLQAELNLKEANIRLRKTEENQASDLVKKKADIEKARINVDKNEKRIREEQQELESAQIKATRSGFVSYLYTWRGQRAKIAEGDQVWRRNGILEIPDSSQMEITVPVNELDITRVVEGQSVEIRVAAIPDEVFAGVVSRKTSVPISASNNPFGQSREGIKEFEVIIAFEAQDERFRQSMTATATIEVARLDSALAAPIEAIFTREGASDTDEAATKYILVRRNDELVEVDVEVGVAGANFAEVKPLDGAKLTEGEMILLRDPRQPGL